MNEEHIQAIQEAAYKVRQFYTFDIFDVEDIEQEAFLIGMEALKHWDGKRDLVTFLLFSMKNRLVNLINKHRSTNELYKSRKLLMEQAAPLESVSEDSLPTYEENHEVDNLLDLIDQVVPYGMRLDYLRMKENLYVPKARREEIIEAIQHQLNTRKVSGFLCRLYAALGDETLPDVAETLL